jgi:hypothetical protein
MLIALTAYSQSARVVIGEDTLYQIKVKNLRTANLMIEERDYLLTENRILAEQSNSFNELAQTYQEKSQMLDTANLFLKKALAEGDAILLFANKRVDLLDKQVKRRNFFMAAEGVIVLTLLTLILIQ